MWRCWTVVLLALVVVAEGKRHHSKGRSRLEETHDRGVQPVSNPDEVIPRRSETPTATLPDDSTPAKQVAADDPDFYENTYNPPDWKSPESGPFFSSAPHSAWTQHPGREEQEEDTRVTIPARNTEAFAPRGLAISGQPSDVLRKDDTVGETGEPEFVKNKLLNGEDSDEEQDYRLRSFEDMNNLFHSHDAAKIPSPIIPGAPGSVPFPYLQGQQSSILALERQKICAPSLFEIVKEPIASTNVQFRWNSLTAADVSKHVFSTMPLTTFGKVPETSFTNVDGRVTRPVLGAMGGDPGEFVLAMATFETVAHVTLSEFQVATFLSDYLLAVNKPLFALQTDTETLQSLCKDISFCLPHHRIDEPPREMFDFLRDKLSNPKYVGSAHLRHLLEHKEFGVRAQLVESFLRSFFSLLWGVPLNTIAPQTLQLLRSKLRVQIMQGPHSEGAILHVDTTACSPARTPLLVPEYAGVSVAIVHDTAVELNRQLMASFLTEQCQKMGLENKEIMDDEVLLEKMNDLGDVQYQQALYLDEFKTPVYRLMYPGACCGGLQSNLY